MGASPDRDDKRSKRKRKERRRSRSRSASRSRSRSPSRKERSRRRERGRSRSRSRSKEKETKPTTTGKEAAEWDVLYDQARLDSRLMVAIHRNAGPAHDGMDSAAAVFARIRCY